MAKSKNNQAPLDPSSDRVARELFNSLLAFSEFLFRNAGDTAEWPIQIICDDPGLKRDFFALLHRVRRATEAFPNGTVRL